MQVLRWWGFSDDFRNEMIFPLVALFFGTGNQVSKMRADLGTQPGQLGVLERILHGESLSAIWWCVTLLDLLSQTPHVSAAIIARVFLDPQLR